MSRIKSKQAGLGSLHQSAGRKVVRGPAVIEAIEPRVFLSAASAAASAKTVQSAAVAPLVTPASPTSLVATVSSSSQINLTWSTTDSLATSFIIERSTASGAFTTIATATKKTYSNTGLAANTTYTYRVSAKNASGTSAPSVTATATTKTKTPAIPTGLTASSISPSQINLAWTAGDSLATAFYVDRSLNGNNGWTRVATVTTPSFSNTGLAANTTYYYRVSATNSVGTSSTTSVVSAKTKIATPVAPKNVTATPVSISQINLSWTAGDTLATGYRIERSSNGSAFVQITNITNTSTTYSNTGLTEGTAYTYRVIAYNTGGSSPASVTATATTLKRPAAPTALVATPASISQINLAWTGDALATGYLVERSTNGTTFTQVGNVTTTSFSNTGLAEGTAYIYRVTATNAAGSSPASATTTAGTLKRPAAPTALTAAPVSISQINLAWTGDALATGYVVERSTNGTTFTQVGSVTTTTFSNTGLAEGTSYIYRVTATNDAGSSPVSGTTTAITLQRPATPTDLSATPISISQINLSWSASDALTTGYIVERSSNGSAFTQIADQAGTTLSDSNLNEGTSYAYRVTAYNLAGSSTATATVSATTLQRPATPTGLAGTPISISRIDLAWSAGDALATGFILERSSDGTSFQQIADVATPTFSDTGLDEGASYVYRVTAYNAGGFSPTSSTATVATLKRPDGASNLVATPVSISSISLTWDSGDALTTGFIVERSSDGTHFTQIADVATTGLTDTGLDEGATYTYRVTSYDAGGLSPDSVTTSAATLQRPAKPTALSATPMSISQINLTWTGDALATGYLIERSADGTSFTQAGDVATASFSDTGLDEGATYTYRITAYNAGGFSPTSDTASAATLQRPAKPTGLGGTPVSNSQINLSWSAADALATGYILERSTDGTTFTQIADQSATTFNDTGLSTGASYVYRVTAYNTAGQSPTSSTATIATLVPPATPTAVVATSISTNEIDLAWTAGDGTAVGYRVERSTNFGAYVQIADIAGATYADTTLSENTIYQYRVTAYSAGGVSPVSPVAKAVTKFVPLPAPPADQPSALNTGVDPSVTLTTVGAFKPKSNTTYTNLYITAQMTLTNLTNIKFINCVMDLNFAQLYNVRCDGATNIVIDHCELKGAASTSVYGDGFTVTSSYIHQSKGDGFKAGNNTMIWGNYVAELGYQNLSAHADGVQIDSKSHIRIIGNYFNMPIDTNGNESNTNLFVQGPARDIIYDHNWSLGGNFSIHAYADGGGGPTVYITNNTFYTGTVRYGFGSIGSEVIWANNWTDTGFIALPASE